MGRSPKISIFIGCPGAPEGASDGRLTRKATQIHDEFVADPRFRPLMQDYLGRPLLVVYVNTPSPWQAGVPEWDDPRFTVRFMTGFVSWNEWVLGEQPSAEVSKDIEPSKEHGRLYLALLKQEIARFKGKG